MSESGGSPDGGRFFPEPPQELSSPSLGRRLAFVGPGVIIASVTIGSGELVWASRSGAIFGCQLLWCFLFAGVFKAIQVYGAARHMTLTGEHPLVSWRSLPGPPLWFPLLIALPTLAVMPIAFSGISEILGGYTRALTGISMVRGTVGPFSVAELWVNIWAAVVLTGCMLLAVRSSLRTLEQVSVLLLAAIVLCGIVTVLVCQPDVVEIAAGLFVPRVPEYASWVLSDYSESFARRSPWLEVALYLTAVGGGTYDYIGYVGMLREKRWGLAGVRVASREQLESVLGASQDGEHELRLAKIWTRAPLWDTSVSFALVILVTLLFAVLGGLVLNPAHRIPANNVLLSEQESFLTQLHPQLLWVYRGGVFLAFVGTLYGAFEIYQHTVLESVRSIAPRLASPTRVLLLRRLTVAYCYLGGMITIWLPVRIAGNVVDRMTFGAVISGATLCGLWCFAMLLTDRSRLPRALQMGWLLWWSTLIAGVTMTGLGVQTLLVYFSES